MADFSDPKGDYNPYAPPAATPDVPTASFGDDDEELVLPADRGSRWWARLVDNFLFFATCLPPGIAFLERERKETPLMALALCVIPLALAIYQWTLITGRGQTIGKRWLGIRVTRLDGSPVGFVHGVLLREWVMRLVGIIPYIGGLIGLVDALMIFGEERRCLHDQLAGTKVVLALRTG